MEQENNTIEYQGFLSSSTLHIIAMASMLCDHIGAVLFPQLEWMRIIGRLAFPIYCFMLAEGYRHTSNAKNYLMRLLIAGVISEVPFDMAFYRSFIFWRHQNVMFNLAISLMTLMVIDRVKKKGDDLRSRLLMGFISMAGFLIATITFTDYYGTGVLLVLAFWQFSGNTWKDRLTQVLMLVLVNTVIFGGTQSWATLAVIPIWLYSGQRGIKGKPFKYFCYAFYPLHLLVLGLTNVF